MPALAAAVPQERCGNCAFFIPAQSNRGECRRYPPQPEAAADYRRFPVVVMDDWCGEWKKQ